MPELLSITRHVQPTEAQLRDMDRAAKIYTEATASVEADYPNIRPKIRAAISLIRTSRILGACGLSHIPAQVAKLGAEAFGLGVTQ